MASFAEQETTTGTHANWGPQKFRPRVVPPAVNTATNVAQTQTAPTEPEERSFVVALVALSKAGQTERAMKLIFRWCDAQFQTSAFNRVASALRLVEPTALDPNLLVGLLSATYPVTHELGLDRSGFATRAKRVLADRFGDERVERIYSRLG